MSLELSTKEKERLEQIGSLLIDEGFVDILSQTNLLPEIGFLDKIRNSAITSGSVTDRLVKVLYGVGTTGSAFALFASHRPDLFSAQERSSFSKLSENMKNKKMFFDSHTANSLLRKLDSKTKFEQLPYLVTPFASYYRGPKKIAKLYHPQALLEIHSDVQLIHKVILSMENHPSRWIAIISEFTDFVVDYFINNNCKTLLTVKKNDNSEIYNSPNGILITQVKDVLKNDSAKNVATHLMKNWLNAVFVKKELIYDLYSWQWYKGISYTDREPYVTLDNTDIKLILTFFTALSSADEQTAASCLVGMCNTPNLEFDLAHRLVSGHRSKQEYHVFETGINILEDAFNEGITIKPHIAKLVASSAQLIYLLRQYVPIDKSVYDEIYHYLGTHNINSQIENTEELSMKETKNFDNVPHAHNIATNHSIEKLAKEIDKSSNRVAYSALIAAFTISGALLVSNSNESSVLLISIPFFGIAFFSSLMLIGSIVREPK